MPGKRRKVIIDTDPGVDDVLALLLALASPELEVLAITTVHGNIDVLNTTRNVISLFNVLHEYKADWATHHFTRGWHVMLAAGARTPLVPEAQLDAAYFHGRDGLGGVSEVFPEYLPGSQEDEDEDWYNGFPALSQHRSIELPMWGLLASPYEAHEQMLETLGRHEEGSVSIIALGPLTNLSLACSMDYATFSKVQEVVIMGGALTVAGNVTPKAEFNFLADPEAAAHVLSFTSPRPFSTNPSSPKSVKKRLSITLLPLDTTTNICLSHKTWSKARNNKSPLKSWCNVFMDKTFETMNALYIDSSIEKVNLSMHDPACIWYLISQTDDSIVSEDNGVFARNGWKYLQNVDVRVECTGTWTRGECVIDVRGRQRVAETLDGDDDDDHEAITSESDIGTWLDPKQGNRIKWITATPGSDDFAKLFMQRVFGQ